MIDSATLDKLNGQPWEELFIQLDEYTNTLLKRYQVRHPNMLLPKGYDAQMVIDETIEALYTGRRTWDHLAKPDFRLFITTQVIRSIVSNLYASAESQLVKELVFVDDDGDEANTNPLELLIADKGYVLENIYEREFLKLAEQLIKQHDNTPNQLVMKVYEGRIDGMKNQQIAKQLDIPVNTVEATMKKLRRILLPLFQ
jgi:DNA-directed RNA polymerase specialized sigma24 family protein